MTGYEPITLRKMMRTRLYYFCRATSVKGSNKSIWYEKLKKQENQIKEYVLDPYQKVDETWKNKALETISKEVTQ